MSFPSLNCPKGVSHRAICISKYMLFTGWEVRIGRNCARGLVRVPPEAVGRGRYSDRVHSFSQYGPT